MFVSDVEVATDGVVTVTQYVEGLHRDYVDTIQVGAIVNVIHRNMRQPLETDHVRVPTPNDATG